MTLAQLSASFWSCPPLPTSKLGPSGTNSWVGGFQDPVGLSNDLSCEAGSFHYFCNPHRFLQSEVLRLYFPILEPWVAQSVSLPSCSSQFICTQIWDHPIHQLLPHLPRLPISAPPTSLDECFFFNSFMSEFHTVRFSGSCGYFLFLNLLLSFFCCVGRESVSTYTFMLAGSPHLEFIILI